MTVERSFSFKRDRKHFILLETKLTFICEGCGKKVHRLTKVNKKFSTQEEAEEYAIKRLPLKLPEGWKYDLDARLLCDECSRGD